MNKVILFLLGVIHIGFAQVGIATTSPKAMLDIEASNATNPKSTDGILIPRALIFPTANPSAMQNGMLFFKSVLSGAVEWNEKHYFNYWDNAITAWQPFITRINDLQDGKTGLYSWSSENYVFLGVDAGAMQDFYSGRNGVGVGFQVFKQSTQTNTAIGYQSGHKVSSSAGLTLLGYQTCFEGTGTYTGSGGSLFGKATIGSAIGSGSLYSYMGVHTTGVGYQALYNYVGDASVFSSGNNALGYEAAYSLVDGLLNDVMGYRAMYENISGNHNVIFGARAGYKLKGSNNVFIGTKAGKNAVNVDKCIFIGHQAGMNETASNRLYIENSNSSTPLIGGKFNYNRVGINVSMADITHTLTVGGDVKATDYTATASNTTYADYVFEKYYNGFSEINNTYQLLSLEAAEAFVKKNRHLPGVPSYQEVKANNFNFNETDLVLKSLEKQEELFLYVTQINQKINDTDALIKELESALEEE